jgi:hypothetical protein
VVIDDGDDDAVPPPPPPVPPEPAGIEEISLLLNCEDEEGEEGEERETAAAGEPPDVPPLPTRYTGSSAPTPTPRVDAPAVDVIGPGSGCGVLNKSVEESDQERSAVHGCLASRSRPAPPEGEGAMHVSGGW